MASTPVSLTIERDTITLDDLGEVVRAFTAYLREVDLGESPTGRRTLDFRLTELSYSSPAVISAVAEPRDDATDMGPIVVSRAIQAVRAVATGNRPPGFRDEALEELRTLASYSVNGRGLRIDAPTLHLHQTVTKAVVTEVDRVFSQGEAIGAIEGQLDTISVHGQPFFTVYDSVSGRGVRCYFDDERRADVLSALGKKVIAHGRLRRDPSGHPREMRDLDYFRILSGAGGSLDALPGIYAGLDVDTYLKSIRRD